jgi:hypothetical protein
VRSRGGAGVRCSVMCAAYLRLRVPSAQEGQVGGVQTEKTIIIMHGRRYLASSSSASRPSDVGVRVGQPILIYVCRLCSFYPFHSLLPTLQQYDSQINLY